MDQYVIQDRVTATKWALKVAGGEFLWEATTDIASAEPIVVDQENASAHYKLLISDGEFGIEATATVQADTITLTDSVTGKLYTLVVSDGQFGIMETLSGEFHRIFFSWNSVQDFLNQTIEVKDQLSQTLGVS